MQEEEKRTAPQSKINVSPTPKKDTIITIIFSNNMMYILLHSAHNHARAVRCCTT